MRLVLAHGCYDILHIGHHWHLQEAKRFGDRLVVSITASEFVDKGAGFPVFSDTERMEQIANLRFVDEVYLCKASRAEPALRHFRPDYFAKGIDYIGVDMVPEDLSACRELGIGLIYTATQKYSSSSLYQRFCK